MVEDLYRVRNRQTLRRLQRQAMYNTKSADPSKQDLAVDPPIVDFLAHDPQIGGFVAEFIPEEKVSPEQKESIVIADHTATARRLAELLVDLAEVLAIDGRIDRIAHAGGSTFDLYAPDGRALSLPDATHGDQTLRVYAILQVLAQEIQLEHITQTQCPPPRRGMAAAATGNPRRRDCPQLPATARNLSPGHLICRG